MQMTLSRSEAELLKQALEVHLLELRGEYVHTDTRLYRHELRKDLENLERLAVRLDQLISQDREIEKGNAA